MNAVSYFAQLVSVEAARRLASLPASRFAREGAGPIERPSEATGDEARAHVALRWQGDLCGMLNAMTRDELVEVAGRLVLDREGKAGELRARLWAKGADLERAGAELPPGVQPRPVVLGGHLVVQGAPRGMYPPSEVWPRPLPEARHGEPPPDEPESVDELLVAADRAIGVRLGQRGRDKGAWGNRAATLLGVIERGMDEPDWRGDVEIKTVPVERETSGLWRVVEDPAIAMLAEGGAIAKLQRTLWLARADVDDDDATIVSWYLLEWDPTVARLARRYLHDRPKGPAGTDQRGLYLHRRFFADAGLLATLNGVS